MLMNSQQPAQVSNNSRLERGRVHNAPPLAKEIMANDGRWRGENPFPLEWEVAAEREPLHMQEVLTGLSGL